LLRSVAALVIGSGVSMAAFGVLGQPSAAVPPAEPIVPEQLFPDGSGLPDLYERRLLDVSADGVRVLALAHPSPFQTLEVALSAGRVVRLPEVYDTGLNAGNIGGSAVLSADGQVVLGTVWTGGVIRLFRWYVDTGEVQEHGARESPTRGGPWPQPRALSPDGRFAYHAEQGGDGEELLYVHDAESGTTRELTFPAGPPQLGDVVVSRDASHLLYRVDDGASATVYRLDLETGLHIVVDRLPPEFASRPRHMAISPDGRYAAFASRWYEVEAGRRSVELGRWWGEPHIGVLRHDQAALSREGDLLLLTADAMDASDENGVADLYLWSPDGSVVQVTAAPDTALYRLVRAGDINDAGTAAVYEGHQIPPSPIRLHRVGLAPSTGSTSAVEAVGLAAESPRHLWTVDGRGIVGERSLARLYERNDGVADLSRLSGASERAVAVVPRAQRDGYWVISDAGRVVSFGAAAHHGDALGQPLAAPIVDGAPMPDGEGYLLVGADGGVFAFGSAAYLGSLPAVLGGENPNQPVVAVAVTPSGDGYRLIAADGGVFDFGDATHVGSLPALLAPGVRLNAAVVDATGTPDGGVVLVSGDGGAFVLGPASYEGSLASQLLTVPIVSVAALDDGYVMLDAAGQLHAFGVWLGFGLPPGSP